jgi:hypothetical protein
VCVHLQLCELVILMRDCFEGLLYHILKRENGKVMVACDRNNSSVDCTPRTGASDVAWGLQPSSVRYMPEPAAGAAAIAGASQAEGQELSAERPRSGNAAPVPQLDLARSLSLSNDMSHGGQVRPKLCVSVCASHQITSVLAKELIKLRICMINMGSIHSLHVLSATSTRAYS